MSPGTIPIGEPGAMMCGVDSTGHARVILVDSAGRVVTAPEVVSGPLELGVLGLLGLLLMFLGFIVGQSRP